MAKNIPIWPGSSSFSSGNTPFGLYDTDTDFTSSADNTADWCAKRLGYPLTDIELQDINFYTCFEEAVSEYGAQLNTYNIRDNLINLYGAETGSNLTQKTVSPGFGGLVGYALNQISPNYSHEFKYLSDKLNYNTNLDLKQPS